MCDAFVTVGTTYEGAGLKASQPFVELTLKWKKDAFIEAMNNDASFSNCRPMITKLVGRVNLNFLNIETIIFSPDFFPKFGCRTRSRIGHYADVNFYWAFKRVSLLG